MGSGIQQVFLNKFFGSRRVLDSLCSTVPEEMNQFDEHILQMHPLRSSLVPKHKCDNLTDTTTKQRKILQVVGWYKNQSKPGWFWFDILVVSVDWVLNILEVVPKLQG